MEGYILKRMIASLVLFSLILSGCGSSDVSVMSRYGNEINDFSVTDQNNETFERSDMEGKVWLLNFMFTNCATVCPPMTTNMTDVVNTLEENDVEDYGILSFSVDPETDSPEALTEYISWYNLPDETEWHLVTGYDYDFIRSFAEKNFKTIVAPPPKGSNQVTHGTSFYLIDETGTVIKDYAGVDVQDTEFPLAEIVSDVETLTSEINN